MNELCKKYTALIIPCDYISGMANFKNDPDVIENMEDLFFRFKVNISCIDITPSEYESCLDWFCTTMEYKPK